MVIVLLGLVVLYVAALLWMVRSQQACFRLYRRKRDPSFIIPSDRPWVLFSPREAIAYSFDFNRRALPLLFRRQTDRELEQARRRVLYSILLVLAVWLLFGLWILVSVYVL